MDRPQEPPTAGGAPPSAAVVDVPVGGPPNIGVVPAMISATIPSKMKRIPKQFFEAPAAAAASPAEAPPAAKKGGRMKTKAAGPRGPAPAKVRTRAISRIGLAPPPPSKATTSPPSWKLRDNEPKCKKEALLTMDDEAEDMSGRNAGKPEGNKKAKERVKVEGEVASFREKLDQLMKSKCSR
nr:uncharacterized protein LOC127304053 [Lolium perenne]